MGYPVPSLDLLPGLTEKPLHLTPDPRASTYAEESRVHLAASLGDRSLSQGAPRRRDGGRDRRRGAERRDAARTAAPASSSQHEAAPAQCAEGMPRLRTRTRWGPLLPGRGFLAANGGGELDDCSQWEKEGECLGRRASRILLWRVTQPCSRNVT